MMKRRTNTIQRFYLLFLFMGCIAIAVLACNKEEGTEKQMPSSKVRIVHSSILPEELEECSAVEINSNNELWMINDSYNTNELFLVGHHGELVKTIRLNGVENHDWEDLSVDAEGNLYVGDFGNNDNDRQDLAIYRISSDALEVGSNCCPEIINYFYEDQLEFPPDDDQFYFDVEAFFVCRQKAYLFTKDRSEPCSGLIKMYELPVQPGTYKAKLLGSYDTNTDWDKGAITSADISPDGSRMALLSTERIWLFSSFEFPDFFSGQLNTMELPESHQYEGLVFKDNNSFYITNELDEEDEMQLKEISFVE